MKLFYPFFVAGFLLCLSGVGTWANAANPTYSALDADEVGVDSPARLHPEAVAPDVNRKPAVLPRVYVENVDLKTGQKTLSYFDYADQEKSQR